MSVTVHHGDCVDVLAGLPDNSIDAIVCDPPYGLEFMGKAWDRLDGGGSVVDDPAEVGGFQDGAGGNPYSRIRYGDGAGATGAREMQAWHERWAAAAFRVLKPGGYLLAFSGTRTYHRLASAIEDAGYEIRDMIDWLYGCLTADAEVLTEHGWKPGIEVEVGDRIAQWDPTTEAVTLAPVERTYRVPWDGPMRVLRNADTDQVLTPNHRVWHREKRRQQVDGVRRTWYDSGWAAAEAQAVTTSAPVRLPLGGFHDGDGIGGEDYAALLGWVWTEGGFDLSGSGVRVYQSSVNAEKVAEIAVLLDRLGWLGPHKRYDRARTYTRRNGERHDYTETTWFLSGALARSVRGDLPGKRPTYPLLWRMTVTEKQAFLRAAMLGDGSGWGSRAEQFHQQHEDDLTWFQTLLALVGRAGKVGMRRDRTGGAVYLRQFAMTELQHRHLADAAEHYTGEVWCVGVPTGAFLARRNGRVFVTGNSGFPKSLDVAKALDARLGVEGTFGAPKSAEHAGWIERGRMRGKPGESQGHEGWDRPGLHDDPEAMDRLAREYHPASPEGQAWNGWGTALKPGHEPIVVARKPLIGTVADNVLAYGTGALNIDASRLDGHARTWTEPRGRPWKTDPDADADYVTNPKGRYPTNVILSHDPACEQVGWREVPTGTAVNRNRPPEGSPTDSAVPIHAPVRQGPDVSYGEGGREMIPEWACVPGCPVAELDAQSGDSSSPSGPVTRGPSLGATPLGPRSRQGADQGVGVGYADAGGASRFFYVTKASTAERNRGLAGFPERDRSDQSAWSSLCRECGSRTRPGTPGTCGHDRDAFEFVPSPPTRNVHPTVKPVDLMRHLVRMVTPPGGTVLDPFLGSGTTGIACVLEGFAFVGIEREAEYVAIAEARIEHARVAPRAWEPGAPPPPKVRTKGDGWEQGALL